MAPWGRLWCALSLVVVAMLASSLAIATPVADAGTVPVDPAASPPCPFVAASSPASATAASADRGALELSPLSASSDPIIMAPCPGSEIAYRDGGDLIVMKDDGSAKSVVYTGSYPCCVTWSPDGRVLAFEDNGVWRLDISIVGGKVVGSNLAQLSANDRARLPAWSPLGDEIAVVADPLTRPSIAVIPPTGGSPQVLYTPPPGSGVEFPTWRFDGTRIAFTETDASGLKAIKILDRATLTISASYVLSVTGIGSLDWARTKDVLAFSDATDKFPGVGQDVFTLDLTTGALTLVVTEARVPSWSPGDGKLVYAKNNKFRRSIVVVDFATGTTTTLARSGDFPSWSRA